MEHENGLIFAYLLPAQGDARPLDWAAVRQWHPGQGVLWLNLDRLAPQTRAWLESESEIPALSNQALLQEDTRPRAVLAHDHALVFLRGANFNPGTEPDDMVSVRSWVDANRLITLHGQPLRAMDDVRRQLAGPDAPRSSGGLLAALALRLLDHMAPVVRGLEEQLDDYEAQLLERQDRSLRSNLAELRRQAINFRRFIAPQRDVMTRLAQERPGWLDAGERERLRETGERLTRLVEDLDALRERAAVSQEEIATRLSDQMNRNMYVMSLAAALFLPLGFVTGLLGINVGGMPGVDSAGAFWIVCLALLLLGLLQGLFFYLRKWL